MKLISKLSLISAILFMTLCSSCNDGKSYAELLDEENKAVNVFLSDQRVVGYVPADSVFEVGEDAPYYKMDEDGNIYMPVLDAGDMNDKVESNQLIYFRFMRYNLSEYAQGIEPEGEGNANSLGYSDSFRFGNYTLSSSSQYGSGIQLPLSYLGIGCEVNLVIKSQYGFTSEISNVVPYKYHVRYFKSQI